MTKKITSIPAASRTFGALSDLGYDFNSAIADIVDNSLTQGQSNNIHILFFPNDQGKFKIRIIGTGAVGELEHAQK